MSTNGSVAQSKLTQKGFSIGFVLSASVALSILAIVVMITISGKSQQLTAIDRAYGICQEHGAKFDPDLITRAYGIPGRPANLLTGGHGVYVVCVSKSHELHQYVETF